MGEATEQPYLSSDEPMTCAVCARQDMHGDGQVWACGYCGSVWGDDGTPVSMPGIARGLLQAASLINSHEWVSPELGGRCRVCGARLLSVWSPCPQPLAPPGGNGGATARRVVGPTR